jgi:hypothetical protein
LSSINSLPVFAEYPETPDITLPELCSRLLHDQKSNWPRLASAYQELADIRIRRLSVDRYKVCLQFNPGRALSSGSAVDVESIKNRPCFLCPGNLPDEQRGIIYRGNYIILCNPAPIFTGHLTIAHLKHQPQIIDHSLIRLLDLACDFAPDYALIYNGPKCGASAPDHLHFQAIPAHVLPLEESYPDQFRKVKSVDGVNIYCGEQLDRTILLLKGKDKNALLNIFSPLMATIQKIILISEEPLINLVCTYNKSGWKLVIFLRSKHRPAAFFESGKKRIFVSPGAIDMAGVIVTPLLNDFQRLDEVAIRAIYQEVSLSENIISQLW